MNDQKKQQQKKPAAALKLCDFFEMSGENEMARGFSESCYDDLITGRHVVIGSRRKGDAADTQRLFVFVRAVLPTVTTSLASSPPATENFPEGRTSSTSTR